MVQFDFNREEKITLKDINEAINNLGVNLKDLDFKINLGGEKLMVRFISEDIFKNTVFFYSTMNCKQEFILGKKDNIKQIFNNNNLDDYEVKVKDMDIEAVINSVKISDDYLEIICG